MKYPKAQFCQMAGQSGLQDVWQSAPEVLQLDQWPDCEYWQARLNASEGFRSLPASLRLVPEVKIGQRRRRQLAKKNRKIGQPTLRRYETSIIDLQEIPMREQNLHDYFNALIWMRFPRAKYALHERTYRSYQELGVLASGNLRNKLSDALTRFDEGGLVYLANGDAEQARFLFQTLDQAAKAAYIKGKLNRFAIFGHGLLEVWSLGGRNITAGVFILEDFGTEIDRMLASALAKLNEPAGCFGTLVLDSILA